MSEYIYLKIKGNGRDKIIRKLIYHAKSFYILSTTAETRKHNISPTTAKLGNINKKDPIKYLKNTESIYEKFFIVNLKQDFIIFLKLKYNNLSIKEAVVKYINEIYVNKTRKYKIESVQPCKITMSENHKTYICSYYGYKEYNYNVLEYRDVAGFNLLNLEYIKAL